jgi:hypothetical protein
MDACDASSDGACDAVSESGACTRPLPQFHMAADCELFRDRPFGGLALPPCAEDSRDGASEPLRGVPFGA